MIIHALPTGRSTQPVACGKRATRCNWTQVIAHVTCRACLIALERDELLAACEGLLGLVQLIARRDDINDETRAALTDSYRIEDADAAIAKATKP